MTRAEAGALLPDDHPLILVCIRFGGGAEIGLAYVSSRRRTPGT